MFLLKAAYTAKEYYRLFQFFCPQNVIVCFCNCDFVNYLVSIIFHGKLLHNLFALFSLTQFVPISGLFVTLNLYWSFACDVAILPFAIYVFVRVCFYYNNTVCLQMVIIVNTPNIRPLFEFTTCSVTYCQCTCA